jgi:hypothetical protein
MSNISVGVLGDYPTTDKNLLSNSSFEETLGSWIVGDGNPNDDWAFSPDEGSPYTLRNTEKAVTGTYCLEVVNDASGNRMSVYQVKAGLTEGDNYVITAQTATDGSSGIGLVVMTMVGEDTYAYNFTGASIGTYTIMVDDTPSADQIDEQTNTSSMALTTFSQFSIHSSGVVIPLFASDNIANEHLYIDDVTLKRDGTGSNIMTDGSFDGEWEQRIVNGLEATGWTGVSWSVENGTWYSDDVGDSIVFTDDVKYGSLALDMASLAEGSAVGVKQQLTGLTAGTTYKIKVWNKDGEESGKVQIYALNGAVGSQSQAYDFVNEVWDADSNTSYSAISGADAGRRKILTGGGSYVQDVIEIVAPANGIIDLAVFSPDGEDETAIVDYVEITEVKKALEILSPTYYKYAGFDMTVEGDANKKEVFTVPTGYEFSWRESFAICATQDGAGTAGAINLGHTVGSEYNDFMSNQTMRSVVGEEVPTRPSAGASILSAGTIVYAYIDDDPASRKSTYATHTVDIYVTGLLRKV